MAAELKTQNSKLKTLEWLGDLDGHLRLIDQTLLPTTLAYRDCRTVEEVWEAIRLLRVRGAPAIGVAAAYGVVLGVQQCTDSDRAAFLHRLNEVADYLRTSRPTAVNLFWALQRMEQLARRLIEFHRPAEAAHRLLDEARAIEEDNR